MRETAEAVYDGAPIEPVVAAAETVRAFGDESALAEALCLLHNVQLGPRQAETRLTTADALIRAAADAGDDLMTLMGLLWRTIDLFLLGNPRAAQSLDELRAWLAHNDCEAIAFVVATLDAMLAARTGELDKAESLAEAARVLGERAGDPDVMHCFGALITCIRWWQGRASEIADFVRVTSTAPGLGLNDHVYVATHALMSASCGNVDTAEEALALLHSQGLGRLPQSSTWLTTQALAIEAAYLLGDTRTAAEAGALIAPFAHLPVMPSLAVVCLGSAERAVGLAALTTGRVDAAIHHLEAAIAADRGLGNRPMRMLTEHTLTAALRLRRDPRDLLRADELTQSTTHRAHELGISLPDHPQWLRTPMTFRPAAHMRTAVLDRTPDGWRIQVDHRTTVLPDKVGFAHLAELLANPGQAILAIELASERPSEAEHRTRHALIDAQAVRAYRQRITELEQQLERPDLDARDVDRSRREIERLVAEIRTATKLGTRPRDFVDEQERSRTAVRKAITRAIADIARSEPDLANHLQSTIRTGASCTYAPETGWNIAVMRKDTDATNSRSRARAHARASSR
jgi:hypothetical protein